MFRKEMQEKLKAIFGVSKVTYDEPGDSYEQDCIFVVVQECRSNTGQGRASARVQGQLIIFSQLDKRTYGFFNKKIEKASNELKGKFFFFDMDVEAINSPARYQNISERRASFIYLYSAQFDPNHGEMNDIKVD